MNRMDLEDSVRLEYLDAMGIQTWAPRSSDLADEPERPQVSHQTQPQETAADWRRLEQEISSCTACDLHLTRANTVFGVGNRQADWLIIGEAPGADEDAKGEPFVGRAGQLLDRILRSIGLDREKVFIANILKCRPPNNRDPSSVEIETCLPFLQRQIEAVSPKMILVVGRVAAQTLLDSGENLGRLRGTCHRFGSNSIPLIVTYHPAYLLRQPAEKRKVWQDLLLAREILAKEHS